MAILRPRDENGKFLSLPPSPNLVSGIYQITNTITGDFYIGSSSNIKRRWQEHHKFLRRGNYGGVHLQRAWTKYGEDAFTFSVLEYVECEKHTLLERERYYIQTLFPAYNIADPINTHLGMKRSEETKEKLRNRVYDDAFREKARQANLGKKHPMSEEQKIKHRQRLSEPAFREKQRQAHLGQRLTPEQRERQLAALRSSDCREKKRQAKLGTKLSPETIAKRQETRRRNQRLKGKEY